MSESNRPTQPNALSRVAANLFPGYFALVMATGIISVACFLLEMKTISFVATSVGLLSTLFRSAPRVAANQTTSLLP